MNNPEISSPKVQREAVLDFRQATVSIIRSVPATLLVTATASYIPISQFKLIFNGAGELVKANGITKMIFDKRQMNVFHQPSMEWYFVTWKEKMFDLGLTRHIKILPDDEVFRQSVIIGRKKINESYPLGKFHSMEILYASSVEEALAL